MIGEELHEPNLLASPEPVSTANLEDARRPVSAEERNGEDQLPVERAHDPALAERAGDGIARRMFRELRVRAHREPLKGEAREWIDGVKLAAGDAEQTAQAVHDALGYLMEVLNGRVLTERARHESQDLCELLLDRARRCDSSADDGIGPHRRDARSIGCDA